MPAPINASIPQNPLLQLPDAEIWTHPELGFGDEAKVEFGFHRRPLDTGNGVGQAEMKVMAKLAAMDPEKFMKVLLADSANGTPVKLEYRGEIWNAAMLDVKSSVENGKAEVTAKIEIFDSVIMKWMKRYLAADGNPPGRTTIEIKSSAQIQENGGLEGATVSVSVTGLPTVAVEKLMELDALRKDHRAALKLKSESARAKAANGVFERMANRLSELPYMFLLDIITDSKTFDITLKEKEGDFPVANVEVGEGKWALTFDDILGTRDGEANLAVAVHGTGDEDKKSVGFTDITVAMKTPLSVQFENGRPVAYTTNPDTGEKSRVDDHAGELMMYLPLALAFIQDSARR